MRSSILAMLLLAGCSVNQGIKTSYVGQIDKGEVPALASDMAGFVATKIKQTDGPVELEIPPGGERIGNLISYELQEWGFAIADKGKKPAHRIRYQVSTLGEDTLVRVSIDGGDAARLYDGRKPLGPFSYREASR